MERSVRKTRLANVDLITNKVMEGVLVHLPNKPQWIEGFFMKFQETATDILLDKSINNTCHRIFRYIENVVDYGNYVILDRKHMMKKLDISQPALSRGLTSLIKKDIICRHTKIGQSYVYRVNPSILWKGKTKNINEARNEYSQNVTSFLDEKRKREKNNRN